MLYYKVRKLENGASLVLPITCFLGKGHYDFKKKREIVFMINVNNFAILEDLHR